MDAFFPSVEQLLIPALRDRPVIVGSGCIASCSYEARRFGLSAGMPLTEAKRRCPQAVILTGHYQIYRCFAEHIWSICRRYCCAMETFLDEAVGELAEDPSRFGGPERLGQRLQTEILAEVGLPVSIGLAGNRMMAKLASSSVKPAGVRVIGPGSEATFLAPLPVEHLLGVGPKLHRKLADMNVETVGDLAALPQNFLRDMLGRWGDVLFERSHGRDARALRPGAPPKTISRETTFHQPTCDRDEAAGMLCYLLQRAMRMARQHRLLVGCLETSIRYDDWKSYATRRTLPEPADLDDHVLPIVVELFAKLHRRRVALRHVGVVLSRFIPAASVGRLFTPRDQQCCSNIQHAIDAVRDRFGHGSMVTGPAIDLLDRLDTDDYGFVLRTPSLTK
ncbi:MAG: DNA polymerase Y family protein [Planctomycetota bacterium]